MQLAPGLTFPPANTSVLKNEEGRTMNRDMPTISIIIPTHNRSASLLRTLDALRVQTYPLQQVEVLVVADGCSDGTVEGLRHYTAP
ncbi:MAG: glycosyl transferase family 2, partial [Candidatus Dadabacteria bacterium]|nr:glycosyl transferase family 2 [Candidatus Dadabacteria bacterium]